MILGAALGVILSAAQLHWAQEAYNIGAPYGLGYTLVGLEGQESSYCQSKHNHWSVGCLGAKRSTVRYIFDPAATRLRLENDNLYSIHAGLAILLYCRRETNSWRRMVACFHWGLPHESSMADADISKDVYTLAVVARMKEIRISND